MYLDEKILRIVFQADDDKKFKEILNDYQENVVELVFQVVKKVMTDTSYELPKVKGIMDLIEQDIESKSLSEMQSVIINAFKGISLSPQFNELLNDTIHDFNENLINSQIDELSDEELDNLLEYLSKLEQNIIKSKQIFERLIPTLKKTEEPN